MAAEDVVAAGAAAGAAPSALVDFVAGTAGGIASLLAGHPFDTVKTRLQAQSSTLASSIDNAPLSTASASSKLLSSSPARLQYSSTSVPHHPAAAAPATATSSGHAATLTRPQCASTSSGGGIRIALPIYRSATDAFRIIIAEERIWGLYKGVTSPMLGVAVMNASIFGMYNIALRYQQTHHLFESAPIAQALVAGMLSGLGSSLITSPIDLIKIREQMDISARGRGTWAVLKHVVRTEGVWRGLYRGWCTTAVRDLGYGPYFASYELMNASIAGFTGKPLSNVDMAASGALAGVVAWLSTFWADVIKTKIQATSRSDDAPGQRSLFWSTARQTYASGGWRAFFVGVGPTVLRALPVNAVLFVTYEATKDLLISRGY